ncbi:TlpA family protein disulfide reductase [Roseivirga pacifica]|uniref:TlpA family protein disulfide reductase n=1 Tax=Roseivirga pacifica TaxID=1267423 RepID=UPI003BAEA620
MKHTSFLFLCLIILGCSKESTKEKLREEKPNQVVLIFKNPHSHNSFKLKNGSSTYKPLAKNGKEITAIDTNSVLERYRFEIGAESDTVIIPTKLEVLEVKLLYNALDRLTYFFAKGDTAIIEYNGNKPHATILNRNTNNSLVNIEMKVRDSLFNSIFPPSVEISNFMLMHTEWSELESPKPSFQEYEKTYQKKKTQDVDREFMFLINNFNNSQVYSKTDSLIKQAALSELYWKAKNYLKSIETIGQLEQSTPIKQFVSTFENNLKQKTNEIDWIERSMAYQEILHSSVFSEFDYKMIERNGKGGGSRTPNYIALYDSVGKSTLYSEKEKKNLQFNLLEQILMNGNTFAIEDILRYLTKFRNAFSDDALTNKLISKYNIKFEIDDALELIDTKGNKLNLKELIAQHNGKAIYLDFWASWCAPCIKEMPSSQSLQKTLADQNIEFIYLSTDRKEKPWSEAIAKHQLNTGLHYRITNADNSKTMEELAVQFIPRYMIFDKNGKLVNNDAPRPSEQEKLIQEFNRYLGQQ